MNPYSVAAMRAEVAALPADLAALTSDLGAQVAALWPDGPSPRRVVLSGSGDSLFAAQAAQYAFAAAGIDCVVRSTQQLLDHGTGVVRPGDPAATLVVGISASGGSAGVAAGLEQMRSDNVHTLALVGTADGPVGRSADAALVAVLPQRPPSPGIRTYQASLLGLLLLAARYGPGTSGIRKASGDLVKAVERTLRQQAPACAVLAERIRHTCPIQVIGGGPALGTARYAAAKIIEGAGSPAWGQDLEEWWHVERFATEKDAPLIVFAPPGPSRPRAVRLCTQARARGHWVAAVARTDDHEVAGSAHLVLPLDADLPPAWSPLIEHLFAGPLAAGLAESLGRKPFHRR